jgi:hypothetical protein
MTSAARHTSFTRGGIQPTGQIFRQAHGDCITHLLESEYTPQADAATPSAGTNATAKLQSKV